MIGFLTCDDCDLFWQLKLVSIGWICIEPFSCLQWSSVCKVILWHNIVLQAFFWPPVLYKRLNRHLRITTTWVNWNMMQNKRSTNFGVNASHWGLGIIPALKQHSLYEARCVPTFLIKHQFYITDSRRLSSPGICVYIIELFPVKKQSVSQSPHVLAYCLIKELEPHSL